jgi:hypothetical protein
MRTVAGDNDRQDLMENSGKKPHHRYRALNLLWLNHAAPAMVRKGKEAKSPESQRAALMTAMPVNP